MFSVGGCLSSVFPEKFQSLDSQGHTSKMEEQAATARPVLPSINALSATLTGFISRVLIEKNFFQNIHVPIDTLLYLANDLIQILAPQKEEVFDMATETAILWKQMRGKPLTEEEIGYLERPKVLDVPREVLNGLKYSSIALMGQNLYNSITSAAMGQLWHHIPAICGYFSVVAIGPRAIARAVTQLLEGTTWTQEQKALAEPWLNMVGRLAIGFTPKVHMTEEGVHYQYPSLNGYSQTISSYQTVTLSGDTLSIERAGELQTPQGSFEGTYLANFKLGSIDELGEERICIQVTDENGTMVPLIFTKISGRHGPEISVSCKNKELERQWAHYFQPKQHVELSLNGIGQRQLELYERVACKSGLALELPAASQQQIVDQASFFTLLKQNLRLSVENTGLPMLSALWIVAGLAAGRKIQHFPLTSALVSLLALLLPENVSAQYGFYEDVLIGAILPCEGMTPSFLFNTRGAQLQLHSKQTRFSLHAKDADKVTLVLLTQGKETNYDMIKGDDAIWWTELSQQIAGPGTAYRYIATWQNAQHNAIDPVSFSLKSVNKRMYSVVVNRSAFQWSDQNWMEGRKQVDPLTRPLTIYEMNLDHWRSDIKNFTALAEPLCDYLKKHHFTHVELYSLFDHGNRDPFGGYRVRSFFTLNSFLGTLDDFRYLVNHLHTNGIGVVADWIPNHFTPVEEFGLFFEAEPLEAGKEPFAGCNQFRYTQETCEFLKASLLYLIEECHIDAVRVDAVSEILKRRGGISFLRGLNEHIKLNYKDVILIAEATQGVAGLNGIKRFTKPINESGLGFDLKWDIGGTKDRKNFLKIPYKNRSGYLEQKWIPFLKAAKEGEKLIFSHSHDDASSERKLDNVGTLLKPMFKASSPGAEKMQWADLRAVMAFFKLGPSRGSLLHMGDEFGQYENWDTRVRGNQAGPEWDLQHKEGHKEFQFFIGDLNRFYIFHPAFWEIGEQGFRWFHVNYEYNVIAYHRFCTTERLIVIHNFGGEIFNNGYKFDLDKINPELKELNDVKILFNSNWKEYNGQISNSSGTAQVHQVRPGQGILEIDNLPSLCTLVIDVSGIVVD